jgi:hypothetical protein
MSNSAVRTIAVVSFLFSGVVAGAESFKVSKVSWADDGLRIEIKTDLPDATDLNVGIADDKNGYNIISDYKYVTVSGGRFVADGFATDRDEKLFRSGRYWFSIAKGLDSLPVIAALPITIPGHKSTIAEEDSPTPSRSPGFEVKQSWVDDVLRITGKTDLPDGTWLNVAIQDKDGILVSDEGFIWAQVKGGRFTAEGFTKDGLQPIPPGRYEVSIMEKMGVSLTEPITVTKRPKSKTKSRLAEVRAINSANYANAVDNQPAASKASDVSDEQRAFSDALFKHGAISSVLTSLTSSGALRLNCDEGKAWIDPDLWQASNAEDKEILARAINEHCSSQSIDIYDGRSAKKLARYGSVLGFKAY